LKEEIYQDCFKVKRESHGKPFWGNLARKYASEGYKNGEHLRSSFKNERKRRGVLGKNKKEEMYSLPRIGICDIETLPGVGYFWGLWDQNIQINQIVSDICLLGWAGKFLNEKEIFSDILKPKEAIQRKPKRIAESCWKFLSKCDAVIGHNFKGFDVKILNTSFLNYNLPPLKFKIIDTLSIARQNFKFTSNKLIFINQKLGIRNKVDNEGFALWKECSEGIPEALQTMKKYNEGDVLANEELFYRIRPYIRNFNVALYNEISDYQCPVCGSTDLKNEGFYYTPAGKWESVRCQKCQCISRKKTNLLDKDKRKSLLINSK